MTIKHVRKRNKEGKVIDAWDVGAPYDLKEGEEFCEEKDVRDWEAGKLVEQIAQKQVPPSNTTSTQLHPVTPSYTQDFVIAMLERGRPIIAQLKSGIHNDLFYFGTSIPDVGTYYPLNAVVTSDRKIYVDLKQERQIKQHLRLHYRSDFEHDALDSHWSTQGIKRFLEGEKPKSIKELFLRLKKINKEFMYYPDEEAHEYVALDIISTYFLPCFEAKGRTFLEAEKGSGKTRQCAIYKLTCFNAIMSADISKASFFRIMEGTCGTLIIDDFDSINDEQKADILQHYKTGYTNTSKSVRTGEGRTRKQETFRNYGHVVMNNTTGLDDISADRSIYLPMLKTEGEITTKTINEKETQWADVRDDLFIIALCYWKEVKDAYQLLTSERLSGRRFQVSRAVLTIASIIGDELLSRLETWLLSRFDDTTYFDPESDWTFQGLKYFFDKDEGDQARIKHIAESIAVESEGLHQDHKDWERKVRGISTFLGKKVFRVLPGVFKVVKNHGQNVVRLVSREKLEAYLRTKGWDGVELGGTGCMEKHVTTEVVE